MDIRLTANFPQLKIYKTAVTSARWKYKVTGAAKISPMGYVGRAEQRRYVINFFTRRYRRLYCHTGFYCDIREFNGWEGKSGPEDIFFLLAVLFQI